MASGSKITMSASDPTAMVPFFGYIPNILAGVVAVISTKRLSPILPSATPPLYISTMRGSTPGIPFGILEKSPCPSCFWVPKVW